MSTLSTSKSVIAFTSLLSLSESRSQKNTELQATAMEFLLKNPFKTSPSISSQVNLPRFHLEEVRTKLMDPVENRTGQASAAVNPPNGRFNFNFTAPGRLYSVAVKKDGSSASVCPENVLVSPIPLTEPTRQAAKTKIMKLRLQLGLNCSGGSSSKQKFCFVETPAAAAADDVDQNDVGPEPNRANYMPDLNSSPPDASAPVPVFVRDVESEMVSRFIDYVCRYVEVHGGAEEAAEYKEVMSWKTETQIENLDSIQILKEVTLGGEIKKALAKKGLIKTPISSDDLPPEQELIAARPLDYKTAATYICKLPCLDETWSKDFSDGEQSNKAKPKKPCLYDYLEIKKPRHSGALGIDESEAPAEETAPIYEADDESGSY